MEKFFYDGEFSDRIDRFLCNKFGYSRNFFHHLIKRGGVTVNDKEVKKSSKINAGDEVKIDDLKRYTSPVILEEAPKLDLTIKKEKEDYLVVFKPKGVLAHPNSVFDVHKPSVVGFLYHRYKDLPSVSNFIRAGLIHRLDKDTEGYMIIVKTEKGLSYFKDLFQRKSLAKTLEEKENVPLKKFYTAKCIVKEKGYDFLDVVENDSLPYYIDSVVKTRKSYIKEFKRGITKVIDYRFLIDNLLEIDLEILTGRTHQIRYHLSSKGLPIVGDILYSNTDEGGLCLASTKLEFEDPEGEYIIVE